MIGKPELCERFLNIVAQTFDVTRASLRISTRYSEDLDGDEMDQVYFVQAIEKEFIIKLKDECEGDVRSIGNSIKYVGHLMGIPGIDEYIDRRELEELGPDEMARRRVARNVMKPDRHLGLYYAAAGLMPLVASVFLALLLDDHLLNPELGSHTLLKSIFPLAHILTIFSPWLALIGLLLQFPGYGYLIGSNEKPLRQAALILVLHVGAVVIIRLVVH